MKVAKLTAELSHAVRLKVGAIIVKDDRVVSIGYNGMPSGWDNVCEIMELLPFNSTLTWHDKVTQYPYITTFWRDGHNVDQRYRLITKPEVLHAESNCISKLAKSNESGDGADLFVTHSPCIDCAKLIYQSGIKRVYFGDHYRSNDGVDFLKTSGIEVIKHG